MAAKQFRHLLNDTEDFLLFIPLRTIHRRFDVIEEFIQFIECELRGLCRSALGRQSLRQMSGQLGVFEDGVALSFREIQLQDSFVREGLGWEVVPSLSTLFFSSCVDGFSFLAMSWSLSFGWRPLPHMARELIRPAQSSSRLRTLGSSTSSGELIPVRCQGLLQGHHGGWQEHPELAEPRRRVRNDAGSRSPGLRCRGRRCRFSQPDVRN